MATSYAPRAETGAIPLSIPTTALWLVGTTMLALLAYYFIGVDQGAVSIFGSDMHVHEFVHDARHFLGFPCH
ncbi:CbtB domain-containing protein [Nocardia miyunensis]|uniref:CbtB domain-containing protein n=1 Tax=Nocardia miyunensis TaxID=282684 RepID=UPI00082D7FFF